MTPSGMHADPKPLDARTQKNIAALEKQLPELERAATDCEKALRPLLATKDKHVQAAVDGALLRIAAVRSVRSIIDRDPSYLTYHLGEDSLKQWREGMHHFLHCAQEGTDPYRNALSGLRTCRSATDGQILIYTFKLPPTYTPTKRYPLDVSLHAGAGLIWRAGWIDGKPSSDPARANLAERIWINPCGRGNNSYAGMGEIAVIEALRDVKKHYSVDENRVIIGGASMGGTGGYRFGAFYPDQFAAAHSLTGWPNYSVPADHGRFDPTLLLDNYAHTALCLWYEPRDLEGVANRLYLAGLPERAKKYPGCFPHMILTDPLGSHGVIDRKLQDEGWAWLHKQKRDPFPHHVLFKTYSLRYPGAYWAMLDTLENVDEPARIEAELRDESQLNVRIDNADRFHLNLARELIGVNQAVTIAINGAASLTTPTGKIAYFVKNAGRWRESNERYPPGLVKKHGLSGPALDVFLDGPVLMVYGTGQKQTKAQGEAMIDEAVLRLFGPEDGGSVLHAPFERRADCELTDSDLAEKHLVLFGTPSQNMLVQRVADKLPVKFLAKGVEVKGKKYTGPGVGLVMVYPNPLNPSRYVLLLPENYGDYTALSFAVLFTFPDYVVGKPAEGYGGQTMAIMTQGTFDARWQLAPR